MQAPCRASERQLRAESATFPFKSFSEHGHVKSAAIVGARNTHHSRRASLSKSVKRNRSSRQIGDLTLPKTISWDAHYPSDASNSSSFREKIFSFAYLEVVCWPAHVLFRFVCFNLS